MQHCLQLTGPVLIHCEPGGLGVASAQHLASKHPVSEKFNLKNFLRQQEAHPPFAGFTVRQPPTRFGIALHTRQYRQSVSSFGLTTRRCASFCTTISQDNQDALITITCYYPATITRTMPRLQSIEPQGALQTFRPRSS
jgi:hypothetical protein